MISTYFHLLMGKNVETSLAAARELVARSPKNFAHLTTLAMGLLRTQDPAAALSVYRGFQIPWDRVAPSQRAVHAAALGLNGKTTEASAEVSALRWEESAAGRARTCKIWHTP